MTESEYLYGVKATEFMELPYKDAIKFKHKRAKLMVSDLDNDDYSDEARTRRWKVWKAMKYNEKLIEEMEG